MKHFVLSRFNLKIHGKTSYLKRDWLEERLVMYKDTVRSLGNQTNRNFKILLLVHPDTPEDFLDKVRTLYNKYKLNFQFLYVDTYKNEYNALNKYFTKMFKESKHKRIITSRIDTDDMYSIYYIEKVKEAVNKEKHTGMVCVDFKKIIYSNSKKNNLYRYPHNTMFLSICSPIPSIHCFSQMHTQVSKIRNIKVINSNEIGGMIKVHGKNVSNKMRGNTTEIVLSSIFK